MLGDNDPIRFTRLNGGYTLQAFGGQITLNHECGKSVEIGDVDDDPVRWHIGTHRCGPLGERWHVGAAPPSDATPLRSDRAVELAALMQHMELALDAADPATFKEDIAFVAGQRAAQSLEAVLEAAGRWREEALVSASCGTTLAEVSDG